MKFDLLESDRRIWKEELSELVPARIFDAHSYMYDARFVPAATATAWRKPGHYPKATRLRQSALRLLSRRSPAKVDAARVIRLRSKGAMARHDGKAARHSFSDGGFVIMASAEFRKDAPWPWSSLASPPAGKLATGCFTFNDLQRASVALLLSRRFPLMTKKSFAENGKKLSLNFQKPCNPMSGEEP